MKKINAFAVVVFAILTIGIFASCQKRDGVFDPDKKISSISISEKGHAKVLAETWKWNKNLLTAIDYAGGETVTFDYNKKDQLISAQSGNSTLQVTYDSKDNNLVESVVIKDEDDNITIKFSHNDDDLIDSYEIKYTGSNTKASVMRLMESTFRFILPEVAQAETQQYYAFAAANTQKGVQDYTVTLTYNDDENISERVIKTYADKITTTYTYTEYINPFYKSLYNLMANVEVLCVNLPATSKQLINNNNNNVVDVTYTYVVDRKYPTEATHKEVTTYTAGNLSQSITNTTIYYYEYVK